MPRPRTGHSHKDEQPYRSPGSEALGHNVATRRAALAMVQEDLATKAGTSRRAIGLIERGKGDPTVQELCQIAHALRCEPAELLQKVPPCAPADSAISGFRACLQCRPPSNGYELEHLLQHLEKAHRIPRTQFAIAVGVRVASLDPYSYKEVLPETFSNRVRSLLVRALPREQLPRPNMSKCSGCTLPETGRSLRELISHLEFDHGVPLDDLADACGVKETTLAQYTHRSQETFPASLRERLLNFYSTF